jgi:integrase
VPRVNLTERYILGITSSSGQRIEVSDEATPGLAIRASGVSSRIWVMRYRRPDGRETRHRLGEYPTMSLRAARLEVGRLRDLIDKGGDPLRERQELKEQARSDSMATYGALLSAYWIACETGEWQPKRKIKRASTLNYERRLSARHVEPMLSAMPLTTIKRATIKALLRAMVLNGIGAQTNRVQALIRQVFNFGISEELVEINPAMGFPTLHAPRPRRRIWKDDELRHLWRALAGQTQLRNRSGEPLYVSRGVGIALQLCILLLQRRKEIAGMDLCELDLDQAVWLIPAERMKGNRPHQVPLPPRSVALIREAIALTRLPADRTIGPVFPNPRLHTEPINAEALTRAMSRLRDGLGVENATVHDLRRTGSTALTSERLGVSPFIRSKVLGHETDAGGGASVSSVHYDANEYMPEKRCALRAWEDLLLHIVQKGRQPDAMPRRTGIITGMMFGLEPANDVALPPVLLSGR